MITYMYVYSSNTCISLQCQNRLYLLHFSGASPGASLHLVSQNKVYMIIIIIKTFFIDSQDSDHTTLASDTQ